VLQDAHTCIEWKLPSNCTHNALADNRVASITVQARACIVQWYTHGHAMQGYGSSLKNASDED